MKAVQRFAISSTCNNEYFALNILYIHLSILRTFCIHICIFEFPINAFIIYICASLAKMKLTIYKTK